MKDFYDCAVIGGGPSGMAAALAAVEKGADTIIIEREGALGGILKQCVHDGFGLISMGRKMAGPEYAQNYIDRVENSSVEIALKSFVSKVEKSDSGFILKIISEKGIRKIRCKALVLASGCRERTAVQVQIHGDRPAGIYTAGAAQHYVNILGQLPGKRCVILGSGDIGLIMARRLTLEGAEVLGVYEAKSEPGGLRRNINSCLVDFDIPLHLSHTVTRTFGRDRLEAVETAEVDESFRPIAGTEKIIPCDCLILSVGLIPENELAESLGVNIDRRSSGPFCDQSSCTDVEGVFSCGNSQHVNDLVDYVSMSGSLAGKNAAEYALGHRKPRQTVDISLGAGIAYCVPQRLDINSPLNDIRLFFRTAGTMKNTRISISLDGREVYTVNCKMLRPPEMVSVKLNLSDEEIRPDSRIILELKEASGLE